MSNKFVYSQSTINCPRSKFDLSHKVLTSLMHGYVTPLGDPIEVLPGDTFSVKVNSLIRMMTPITAILDDIEMNISAFYVPKRLLWNKTKQFYGENEEGYGIPATVQEPRTVTPYAWQPASTAYSSQFNTVGTHFGLVFDGDFSSSFQPINLLPIRSFFQCWNDWFRNPNFQSPYLWNHNQTGDLDDAYFATRNGYNIDGSSILPHCLKNYDIFTSCLPWTQRGPETLLPLGDLAPVITTSETHPIGSDASALNMYVPGGAMSSGTKYVLGAQATSSNVANVGVTTAGTSGSFQTGYPTNLWADLSSARAASINQIRIAFCCQRFYEAMARLTSGRYREVIFALFGVSIGDTTAQMSEYLGTVKFGLNIDQVVSTAGYQAGSGQEVGQIGAVSVTGNSNHLFTKSFVEPGYLVFVGYAKHNRSYSQGISDVYMKHDLFDYYAPQFAFLSEQPINMAELYCLGHERTDTFGFQEAWASYRSRKNIVRAAMNPYLANSLNYWNLADKYANQPALNESFLIEDRDSLKRALTSSNGPDYACDFWFDIKATRPLPVYSIPGLVDHM